jgi:hypothetical protein
MDPSLIGIPDPDFIPDQDPKEKPLNRIRSIRNKDTKPVPSGTPPLTKHLRTLVSVQTPKDTFSNNERKLAGFI